MWELLQIASYFTRWKGYHYFYLKNYLTICSLIFCLFFVNISSQSHENETIYLKFKNSTFVTKLNCDAHTPGKFFVIYLNALSFWFRIVVIHTSDDLQSFLNFPVHPSILCKLYFAVLRVPKQILSGFKPIQYLCCTIEKKTGPFYIVK